MKTVLITKEVNAPSTVLNRSLLELLPNFQFSTELDQIYADVILFMGYDPKIEEARKINPNAIIGIIDPRPGSEVKLRNADFYLANGVEMVNFFASTNSNYFIYPIYPPIKTEQRIVEKKTNKLSIGYHGNKAHLELMESTVCKALEKLAKTSKLKIELVCIYNFEGLGKWNWKPESNNITIEHIQWTNTSYQEYLPSVDIGIVPNLIPFKPILSEEDNSLEQQKIAFDSDVYFRFKPTSNLGRILVFSQLGIPVIADMFPSAAEIIRHGENGLLATDADSWYIHLKRMATNDDERKKMADSMHNVFLNHYHWDVKNKELLEFFEKQIELKRSSKSGLKERLKSIFS